MKFHELAPKVSRKKHVRHGQGDGSGRGSFSGRGCKGQNSRAGGGVRVGFEGGQTPLLQRMPKKHGFRNPRRIEAEIVQISQIEEFFNNGDLITRHALKDKKLIQNVLGKIKILSDGEISKKVTISADILISGSAKALIEKTGGKVEEKIVQEEKPKKIVKA